MTLREMRQELTHAFIGPLALRTLNRRVHQLKELTPDPGFVPCGAMVLHVDALWFTQLVPNGHQRRDRSGRLRAVKARRKRCLLVALAVWPDSGHQEILGWQLADSEDAQAWTHFLSMLEAQGVRAENGLTLLVHDGGEGLCKALHTVHFGAPQQRCLFHKLRNIAAAFRLPENLSRQERSRLRKGLLKDFRSIWQALHASAAIWRYLAVWHQYRDTQPEAVAALRRDFRMTLSYFAILQQHPTLPKRFLRATSRLERFNRSLRRHIRSAGAYHSDEGILAVIAYEADHFYRPVQSGSSQPAQT
jgi:transposase-like protein